MAAGTLLLCLSSTPGVLGRALGSPYPMALASSIVTGASSSRAKVGHLSEGTTLTELGHLSGRGSPLLS
ncbi:hypothetical protein E2C01_044694 [Portunus trituberculatus]|uniref:Secreted protein n=1 Tax=Portunus trituberculatus TaxID=210409 RepID=A0A5B7FSS7_PORTR|nr:hypothetical protein [Portunus trituberculatus]